jgi:hypothetical protein
LALDLPLPIVDGRNLDCDGLYVHGLGLRADRVRDTDDGT